MTDLSFEGSYMQIPYEPAWKWIVKSNTKKINQFQ